MLSPDELHALGLCIVVALLCATLATGIWLVIVTLQERRAMIRRRHRRRALRRL
jgi:hypothetical protein